MYMYTAMSLLRIWINSARGVCIRTHTRTMRHTRTFTFYYGWNDCEKKQQLSLLQGTIEKCHHFNLLNNLNLSVNVCAHVSSMFKNFGRWNYVYTKCYEKRPKSSMPNPPRSSVRFCGSSKLDALIDFPPFPPNHIWNEDITSICRLKQTSAT